MYSRQQKKGGSYLPQHPKVAKRLSQRATPKLQIPQQQYNRKKGELYFQQQAISNRLTVRAQSLQEQNNLFKQSLVYFDPTLILAKLQRQLLDIKHTQQQIREQIEHCERVQRTSSAQEYFLFKKNRRVQSFNDAMNQLYEEMDREREGLRQVAERVGEEMSEVKGEIQRMQGELSSNYKNNPSSYKSDRSNNNGNNGSSSLQRRQEDDEDIYQDKSNNNRESINQSRVNVIVQSTISYNGHYDQHQKHHKMQHQQQKHNASYISSSQSSSSIDPNQLEQLQQQYKSLLQTYEIVSENNQIMTTQLFNNIQTIQDTIDKLYHTETNKLYRDLLLIKEDFSYMPLQHIIPPTNTQLNYSTQPLINDYNNKLAEIKNKLSTDLKSITNHILTPLNWKHINIEQYLLVQQNNNNENYQYDHDQSERYSHKNTLKSSQQTNSHQKQKSKEKSKEKQKNNSSKKHNKSNVKQTLKQCQKLQQTIKTQDQLISNLEFQLQQIMGDTMVFKQKQHQLQLAMHNMRKMLKQTQQQQQQQQNNNQQILF